MKAILCDFIRISHQRCPIKNVFLKISQNSQKNLCQSFVFNKVTRLIPAALLKKRLWHRCFSVNFMKSLRTPFLQNTSSVPCSFSRQHSLQQSRLWHRNRPVYFLKKHFITTFWLVSPFFMFHQKNTFI